MKNFRKTAIIASVFAVVFMMAAGLAAAQNEGNESALPDGGTAKENNKSLVIVGSVIAMGIAGVASAVGLGLAGTSAVAVTAEKPELFGKCLVLQVLPMTQAVYGLLTAILLMMGAGFLGGGVANVTYLMGMGAVLIGVVVGTTGISGVNQGMVASSSISALGRNPDVAARGIIFTVMPETIAIFGLLVGILLMTGLNLL
ncbi:MAG: hypothetical protein V5A64_01085 [Candidatus Thermoplasmatota archaeon]